MTPSDLCAVAVTLTDPSHANPVEAVNWAAAVHGHAAIVRLAEWVVGHPLPAHPIAPSDIPHDDRKAA